MTKWNNELKLIISDVDETVADLYVKAEPEMITELTSLLQEGKIIFFVTGQGIKSVQWRITNDIPKHLRSQILIGHCSGAEVWGHDQNGDLFETPYYSVYKSALTETQKLKWRELVEDIVNEFKLVTFPTMPISEFIEKSAGNPLSIMIEDRGPQITLEVINGYDLTPEKAKELEIDIPETHGVYDLRIPILEKADAIFRKAGLPITPRLAGVFAVDFAVKGVSKTTAVKHVLNDDNILNTVGLSKEDIANSDHIEIWGDKFSVIRGGSDRHMSEALPLDVRSIDFREENPDEFIPGYNIVVWDGKNHLHEGLLEYLQLRKQ